jgi:predicted deacylase
MNLRSLFGASNISRIPPTPFPPVTELVGTEEGKTLLVTAGMDGDEYAGVEAAFSLIKKYSVSSFHGKLIIIPIVNISGFLSETSYNPDDNKYPKHIFPGNPRGTPSEKLISWIFTTYAERADAWIDLHGGALGETLSPFLWCFKTGTSAIDVQTNAFCNAVDAHTIIIDETGLEPKTYFSKRRKAPFILAESGELGKRSSEDIQRHISWTEALMSTLQMINRHESSTFASDKRYFRRVTEVSAPFDGICTPLISNSAVSKGDVLGTITSLDTQETRSLYAPVSGYTLWHKVGMGCRKGSVVFGIACEPIAPPY